MHLQTISKLSPAQKRKLKQKVLIEQERRRRRKENPPKPLWQPNPDHEDGTPNPQRLAYESEADVIGLSGTARWGKTDLFFGFAANKHKHSVMFRRKFKSLRSTIERSRKVFNPNNDESNRDSYNEMLHRWIIDNRKRIIEFDAIQYEHNKEDQRGKPRDLIWFDEATEFTETIVDFVSAWNFSADENQKCRTVLAFNVPASDDGEWVIQYFLPWIAYLFPQKFNHHNPAKPGELRWYAVVDGKEIECENGEPFWNEATSETIQPLSRTFFFGELKDNPYVSDRYKARLQSLPEPLRSQLLYGNFAAEAKADPWQVIPTKWVKMAQKRWLEREKPDMPVSGVGLDVARGGIDNLVISKRYGTYFEELTSVPGIDVEDGPMAAGLVYNELQHAKYIGYINVDVIGVGTSAYDSLKAMYPGKATQINVAEKSYYKFMSKGDNPEPIYSMRNKRAEMHWRMREALDPVNGEDIALPDDNELVADLCAAKYKVMAGGVIQIESKEDIIKRIGRSPDKGEAVMLAWFDETPIIPGGESLVMDTNIYKSRRKR